MTGNSAAVACAFGNPPATHLIRALSGRTAVTLHTCLTVPPRWPGLIRTQSIKIRTHPYRELLRMALDRAARPLRGSFATALTQWVFSGSMQR